MRHLWRQESVGSIRSLLFSPLHTNLSLLPAKSLSPLIPETEYHILVKYEIVYTAYLQLITFMYLYFLHVLENTGYRQAKLGAVDIRTTSST